MRSIINTIIFLNNVRKGIIPISGAGFWRYRAKPDFSLKRTAKLFNKLNGKVIVEIGTGLHKGIAGQSMLIWSKYTNAENIYAVDLDHQQLETLNQLKSKDPRIHTYNGDGLNFLDVFDGEISLLYLDFWVQDNDETIEGTKRSSQYQQAYIKARDKMASNAMILIDDSDHILPWKQSMIVPGARKDGFKVLWIGRQTLLVKEKSDSL